MAAKAQLAFSIRGPIARSDLPGLSDRVCELLRGSRPGDVHCDVRGVEPDAVTVDALARLQLAARRRACHIVVLGASEDLRELIASLGLDDVLLVADGDARVAPGLARPAPRPTE